MSESRIAVIPDRPRPAPGITTRVAHGSLWILSGYAITLLASFIATPFTIRLLGAEAYGVMAVINALVTYIGISNLHTGASSTRFGAEAYARHDNEGEVAVVWTALTVGLIPASLAALSLALAARPLVEQALQLPAHLHDEATIALQLAALGFLARSISGVVNTPQLVRLRLDLDTLITAGATTVQVLLVPVGLLLGGGLIAATGIVTGVQVVTFLIHAVVSRRIQPRLLQPRITASLFAPMIRFGGGAALAFQVGVLLMNSEKLFLAHYSSASAVAHYSVAFMLASLLILVPQAMNNSLLPAFSGLQSAHHREQLQQLYTRAIRGNLLFIAPAALALCVIAKPFLTLWAGPEYGRESVLPAYILAIGVTINVIEIVPCTLLMALGKSGFLARFNLIQLIPYLLCVAFLTSRFGAVGAALAWSLRFLVEAPFLILAARRISSLAGSPLPTNRADYVIALMLLFLPVLLLSAVTSSTPLQIIVSAASLTVYSALVWTRVLTSRERQWLRGLCRFSLNRV